MKLLMSLSILSLFASCSTTSTAPSTKTLSLEEIAEKSQTTSSILGEEKLDLNVNNTYRLNGKDAATKTITE